MFLWSYVFVFLAAFFKACADAFENSPNFNESIFRAWNKKFWCKDVSWQYAKRLGGYKLDSWHISISMMVACWCLAVIVFKPYHEWWVHVLSIGIIWNVTFVFFYHRVFKIK